MKTKKCKFGQTKGGQCKVPKGAAWGIGLGDKVKARWFNDPKWYVGIVKYDKADNEYYISNRDLKKRGLFGGLSLADDVKKVR